MSSARNHAGGAGMLSCEILGNKAGSLSDRIETIVLIETKSLEASVIGILHILDLRSARVCLVSSCVMLGR